MNTFKKKWLIVVVMLTGFVVALLLTNPSEADYIRFEQVKYGQRPEGASIELERINFYIFSTYTPIRFGIEPGVTHLGIFKAFVPISKGQFDYPEWLRWFK